MSRVGAHLPPICGAAARQQIDNRAETYGKQKIDEHRVKRRITRDGHTEDGERKNRGGKPLGGSHIGACANAGRPADKQRSSIDGAGAKQRILSEDAQLHRRCSRVQSHLSWLVIWPSPTSWPTRRRAFSSTEVSSPYCSALSSSIWCFCG